MATTSLPVQRAYLVRAKYVVFAFVGLMIAYVLQHNESFVIHPNDPVWQHYHPFHGGGCCRMDSRGRAPSF